MALRLGRLLQQTRRQPPRLLLVPSTASITLISRRIGLLGATTTLPSFSPDNHTVRRWTDDVQPAAKAERRSGRRGGGRPSSDFQRVGGRRGSGDWKSKDSKQEKDRRWPHRRFKEDWKRDDNNNKPPPTVERVDGKAITVAAKAKGGGGGGGSYCFGCGAAIVKAGELQEPQTTTNHSSNNANSSSSVNVGLKRQKSSYWDQKKQELKISKLKNWALCPRCRTLKKNQESASTTDSQLEALSPSHEMTQIFRDQVSKLRSKKDAVVVLCVDAVNVKGSLIKSLRKYIGGNPILLAVTRCDLLPDYISEENWSKEKEAKIKAFFAKEAAELKPANVYLCSVGAEKRHNMPSPDEFFAGSKQLADDLWNYLEGRDPYIVGAANIGKSTLTDSLIDEFIERCTEMQAENDYRRRSSSRDDQRKGRRHSRSRDDDQRKGRRRTRSLEEKRYEKIQESRVTKSSLPGTTLQNIRVPCFPDHTQALWDTPGLLLDPSVSHFPIRNFRRLKAMRPTKIEPQFHTVEEKSFAFLVYENIDHDNTAAAADNGEEEDDPLPLLRIEVRLKKEKGNNEEPGPVSVVWNSTLGVLSTKVASIDDCLEAEKRRMNAIQEYAEDQRRKEAERPPTESRTPEERVVYKERKLQEHLQKVKAEKEMMGAKEWNRRKAIREEEEYKRKRLKALAMLQQVYQEELVPGKAIDFDVAHFGSLGILAPRRALVRVFAPSDGVSVSQHPMISLPPGFEDGDNDYYDSDGDEYQDVEFGSDDDDDDVDFDLDDDGFDDFDDSYDFDEYDFNDIDGYGSHGGSFDYKRPTRETKTTGPRQWEEFSGERVGWRFHDKPHFVKGTFVDGWQPIKEEEKGG